METSYVYVIIHSDFFVLTVPMRNGNVHNVFSGSRICEGSYRTYEEWKLYEAIQENPRSISSYRTYEEWKPNISVPKKLANASSYRTYEEWKLASVLFKNLTSLFSSYRTYEEWKLDRIAFAIQC